MKGFIFTLLCCLLATGKVTAQGFFAKKSVKTLADGVFFNGMIFFFAMLIFLPWAFGASRTTILYAVPFGLTSVLFQATYIQAMSKGKASIAIMLMNLSMVFPVLYSVLVSHENLSVLRLLGVVLTAVAVIISAGERGTAAKGRSWLVFALIAFLLNGGLAIWQKLYTAAAQPLQSQAFTAWTYVSATVGSVILYGVLHLTGQRKTFRVTRKATGTALAAGIFLGLVMFLITYTLSLVEGIVFFPSYYGGSLVLSTLSGIFILREKLKRSQLLGIGIGVAAIVLLNVG